MIHPRPARLTDASDLHRNCFPEQPLNEVQEYLHWCMNQQARGRIVRLVAEVEGHVVANGQLTVLHGQGEIGSLAVAAPYRRRGIGTALVRALIDKALEFGVHTLEISAPADAPWIQAWYQRLGFSVRGTHTFPGQEQVVVLQMELTHHGKDAAMAATEGLITSPAHSCAGTKRCSPFCPRID